MSTQNQTAEYVAQMLGELRQISISLNRPLLTCLIEMAIIDVENIKDTVSVVVKEKTGVRKVE